MAKAFDSLLFASKPDLKMPSGSFSLHWFSPGASDSNFNLATCLLVLRRAPSLLEETKMVWSPCAPGFDCDKHFFLKLVCYTVMTE